MSHEFNDNVNKQQPTEHQGAEALFLKIHEDDKVASPKDDLTRMLEANEKAIADAYERVANIAMRAYLLSNCGEPHHFETLKDIAATGAAANEPAYAAFHKHMA